MECRRAILVLLLFAVPAQAAIQLHYLHNDHLGTPRVVTNRAQAVVWKGQLKPFGETGVEVEAITNHRRFPGQRLDIESRLHYNYFRDYDPGMGRYIQSDPIGLGGGLNTYAYVEGNPVSRFDLLGLDYIYQQSTGQMSHQPLAAFGGGPPELIGKPGYSGSGQGLNNPALQHLGNIGPPPQGVYTIEPQKDNVTLAGTRLPASMRLTPDPNNQMFGRGGFLIHGDNRAGDKSASQGCPIFPRDVRDLIANSNDNILRVVP